MEYDELKPALEADRGGLFSPVGDDEAIPLRESDGRTSRVALRRGNRIRCILDAPWRETVALAFSSDGERLAAAGAPTGVCVWEVRTGALLAKLTAPRPWMVFDDKPCLPLRFAPGDHLLLVGGNRLSVADCENWALTPVAEFPVVAIVPDDLRIEVRIVGPDENGAFPVEALDLDTFTMSARGIVLQDHPSSTSLFLGIA